jgi:hypothetical protein
VKRLQQRIEAAVQDGSCMHGRSPGGFRRFPGTTTSRAYSVLRDKCYLKH